MDKRKLFVLLQVVILVLGLGCFSYYMTIEKEVTPCSPGGFPGRCYYASEDVCEMVWTKSKDPCKGVIDRLHLPPLRIISPILKKCQMTHLDRALASSRKPTYECAEMKKDLDGWRARNTDFTED